MKLIKTASGKYKLTKQAWKEIGEKSGWIKKAQTIEKVVNEAIKESITVPEDIQAQAEMANYDLYHGPVPEGDIVDDKVYLGFVKAVEAISGFVDEFIGDIYVNHMSGEVAREPLLEDEMDLSDWIQVDRSSVLKILFGKELASYV